MYDSREIIYGDAMKKIVTVILCICLITLLVGCSVEKMSLKKLRDIDFTVVDEEQIPKELKDMIEEKEEEIFKTSFGDQGSLYIAVGYGKQATSGYSIEVKELYETENAIYIHTNLIGPTREEKIVERDTYPYIVVKLEYIDKNVVFQ